MKLTEGLKQYEMLEALKKKMEEAEAEIRKNEVRKEKAEAVHTELKKWIENTEKAEKSIAGWEENGRLLGQLKEQKTEEESWVITLTAQIPKLDTQKKACEELQKKMESAVKNYRSVFEDYEQKYSLFFEEQAGILAAGLRDRKTMSGLWIYRTSASKAAITACSFGTGSRERKEDARQSRKSQRSGGRPVSGEMECI